MHQRRKYACKECEGSAICENEKHKAFCKDCGGNVLCKDCGGNALCKTPHCTTQKNPKYDGYCWYCFANLFPDTPVARNYKTKENTVATFLKEKFPDVTWKCDKRVEDGCSRRRPDLLDMGSHVMIVEVDEISHDGYDPTCE